MQDWQFLSIIALVSTSIIFSLWAIIKASGANPKTQDHQYQGPTNHATEQGASQLITPEFRDALQHTARAQFEKIIQESAHFIEQDVRISTSQLNDYIKTQITGLLKDQFEKYGDSIIEAEKIALTSLEKSRQSIEQQRLMYQKQLMHEMSVEKQRIIANFEAKAAQIIKQYTTSALHGVMSGKQLESLENEILKHKKDILEDIGNE